MDKEPKILKVPSPGDGKYVEQITRGGGMAYVFYQPANALKQTETIAFDTFHTRPSDGDAVIHLIPMRNPMWLLPGEPEEPGDLWRDVRGYIYRHIDFLDPRLYDVATAWVFATWMREAFNIAPYFRLYGTRNTGKTRVLEVFQHLCYRAVLTPSASEAALFRLIQDYHVTFLLDESEIYGSEARESIQGILNGGYRRGQQVLRCESAEDGTIIVQGFDIYGHKAIAGTETLKQTLESRCIPVVMERATRRVNFTVDIHEAKRLRSRLLLWRFRRLADLDRVRDGSEGGESSEGPLEVGSPDLHLIKDTRIIEIFTPLLTLADGEETKQSIIDFALNVYEENVEEDATGPEAQILTSIQLIHDNLENGKFSTREVTDLFNADKGETERWKASSIGRLIKKLGFKQKRLTGGRSGFIYDADKLSRLSERYGTPPLNHPSPPSLTSLASLDSYSDASGGANEPPQVKNDEPQGVGGGLQEDLEKLLKVAQELQAEKGGEAFSETELAERVFKILNWTGPYFGKIFNVLGRDGLIFSPRPGYWRCA